MTDNTRELYSGVSAQTTIDEVRDAIRETLAFHGINFGDDKKLVDEVTIKVMTERGEKEAQSIKLIIEMSPLDTSEHTNL